MKGRVLLLLKPVDAARVISFKNKIFRIDFRMPPGQGLNQELQIIRGSQRSRPVYVNFTAPEILRVCSIAKGAPRDIDINNHAYNADALYSNFNPMIFPKQADETKCVDTNDLLSNEGEQPGLLFNTIGGSLRFYGTNLGISRPGNTMRSTTMRIKDFECTWLDDMRMWDARCDHDEEWRKDNKGKCDKLYMAGTRIQCKVPAGQGPLHILQVEVGKQVSNGFAIGFHKPLILNVAYCDNINEITIGDLKIKELQTFCANMKNATISSEALPTDSRSKILMITGRNFGVTRKLTGHPNKDSSSIIAGQQLVTVGSHVCIPYVNMKFKDVKSRCMDEHKTCALIEETENREAVYMCQIPHGQGVKHLTINVASQTDSRVIMFNESSVTNVELEICPINCDINGSNCKVPSNSQKCTWKKTKNVYGRTDGLHYGGTRAMKMKIVGENLGLDGLLTGNNLDCAEIWLGDRGNTEHYNNIYEHYHDHIIMDVPVAFAGLYQSKDMEVRVKVGDGCAANGLKIKGNTASKMSYGKPDFIEIKNKFHGLNYTSYRPEWKDADAGNTDGWYAVLHGSNFGEGCNGNCLDESGNKIRKDVLHKTGTLRWMAQKYVLGGVGSSAVRTEFWETVDIKTVKGQINEECECLARYGPEKSKWPGDCHGEPKMAKQGCPQILWWNHTHIEFFVRGGIGYALPLQLETGFGEERQFPQKSCEVADKRLNMIDRIDADQVPFNSNMKDLFWASDKRNIQKEACYPERSDCSTIDECSGMKFKECFSDDDCVHGYCGKKTRLKERICLNKPWLSKQCGEAGEDVGVCMKEFQNPVAAEKCDSSLDCKHGSCLKRGHQRGVCLNTVVQDCFCKYQYRHVMVNYDRPVIDKISPDTIAGHVINSLTQTTIDAANTLTGVITAFDKCVESGDCTTSCKGCTTKKECFEDNAMCTTPKEIELKSAIINATFVTKDLYPPPVLGAPGEEIKITGQGFGKKLSFPNVTIDGYDCIDAQLHLGDKQSKEPYITCMAPLMLVGDKGYNANTGSSKIQVLVGGQYAMINPDMKASSKLKLLRTHCRKSFYGMRDEKCLKCPAPKSDNKPAGSECSGEGPVKSAEPLAGPGWYALQLVKDEGVDATGNRSFIGPYIGSVSNQNFVPWTRICVVGNTTDTRRVKWYMKDNTKCHQFDSTEDQSATITGEIIIPQEAAVHSNKKGKPLEFCQVSECSEVYGWIGRKGKENDAADSKGCLLPHEAYGDPRWYKLFEDRNRCESITHGYYSWEENLPWHFMKPKRIAMQKIGVDRCDQDGCQFNACHRDRWHRNVCPHFIPCEPVESCIGANRCGNGYAGKKCNKCDQGSFRIDGYCVSCPEEPLLMLIMFLVGGLCAAAVFAVIAILKINVGVVSIGIDYFQVLSMFGTKKIPWPNSMVILFDYLSAFSFNLDLAAPDCVGGGIPVYVKWFLTEFIPIGMCLILAIWTSLKVLILMSKLKTEKSREKETDSKQIDSAKISAEQKGDAQHGRSAKIKAQIIESIGGAFSMFLSIFYLMYLNLTKKAMDVFNCSPGDPPDDPASPTLFMDMAPDQICYTAGSWETGLHTKLIPWGYACVIAYGLAFPVFIWFKFGNYKEIIFEDQVLFAQDRGRSPDTNPHFAFRKRYSKLYKNYKPEKWYWVIVILVKKLGLCFTALMFKRNPMFQLSVAVMILFWATTMQLNHRPFMSMIERSQIVDEASKRDFQRGEKLVRKMNAFGGDAADIEKLQNQLKMEETAQKQISYALKLSAKYFVNYNDVESVFLVASIFVCLSGVMFGSGYFTPSHRKSQESAMCSAVVCVVAFSFIYYCYVIGMEITGQKKYNLAINKAKWQSFKKKAAFHKDLFRTTNDNASPEEKEAATRIEAAFKGRKSRQELHDKIMENGTEEQKKALRDLEKKRKQREEARIKKEKKRAKRARKKKKGDRVRRSKSKGGKKKRSKSKKAKNNDMTGGRQSSGKRLADWGGD